MLPCLLSQKERTDMCGIASWFCRESVPSVDMLYKFLAGTEKRGQNGYGICIIRRYPLDPAYSCILSPKKMSEDGNAIKELLSNADISIGDIVFGISRAAPETETSTQVDRIDQTMQPIIKFDGDIILMHNGAVSNRIVNELKEYYKDKPEEFKFETDIDSEAIVAAYIKSGRNIKETCEYLSGGFACIMYDRTKDQLYTWNDFKPISQAYVRGHGYLLHSDDDVNREVCNKITGTTKDGVCVWECYYSHYMNGGAIREIDLDSGFMKKIPYSPRYITHNWDSNAGKVMKVGTE